MNKQHFGVNILFKLLKFLKKYKKTIPLIIVLIVIQAISTLMLPDYMSKIISEGIKSPAYEMNQSGEKIKAIISPYIYGQTPFASSMTVKQYNRTKDTVLYLDGNYATLSDENGNPLTDTDENGFIKGKISYEKDQDGNYILDADTGEKIVKYARANSQNEIVTDSYIVSDNNRAKSTGTEKINNVNIIAPIVIDVTIYNFENEPAPLKLDEYDNAYYLGFYTDNLTNAYSLKMGNSLIPAFKFDRVGTREDRYGKLLLDADGNAKLKQVSYISVIVKYGLIMLGITFLISICAITASYMSSNVSMKLGKDIRSKLYKKVSSFSVLDAGKIGTASLITRTTNDVTQVQMLVNMIFRMVVMTPIMFIGGLIMALNKNVSMTLVLLVTIPLILLLLAIVGKKVIPLFKSMQIKLDNLTLVARENLSGVRVIRAFNREKSEDVRFDSSNKDVMENAIKANRLMSVMFPSVMLLMSLTSLAIIAIAVFIAKNDILGTSFTDFADMMAVTQYIMQIMMSLLMVMMLFVMFPRASASANRINEVLEAESNITDPVSPEIINSNLNKSVIFENVSFKFEGSENPVLSNINFEAKKGEVTAIIGGTGSGKSTLVSMIARLFDATEGKVLVNGTDVRKYRQKELRKKISFVTQKSLLFSGTIADNLKFGNENSDEEKMIKALEAAQAKDFVMQMSDGLNSAIEHGGVNLSGGQKQRLSIARAIIKDAEIYIFDDSFSALDFKTDYNLRMSLKKDLKDSTVILVSQRIGTVMNADNIIVLEEGKISGTGKHKELIKNCKVYREIALSQLSQKELS